MGLEINKLLETVRNYLRLNKLPRQPEKRDAEEGDEDNDLLDAHKNIRVS